MPRPKVRNLKAIRAQNPLIYEAFQDLIRGMTNISNQTNSHPEKPINPPPPVDSLIVTGSAGVHDVQLQHNTPVNRGVHYFLEWDTSKDFTNFKTVPLGPARNWRGQLNVTGPVFFRAYPSYLTSAPATPTYFGTPAAPQGVDAGKVSLAVNVNVTGVTAGAGTATGTGTAVGVVAGPAPQLSTGSGTEPSLQPQGGAGFGFRPSRGGEITEAPAVQNFE